MKKLEEMTICVVGLGQIGGSFALALRRNGVGNKIIGVDKKKIVNESKIKELVDHATTDLESAVEESDFIFLSTPVLTILELLPQIISHMKPEAILLDSGSTKKDICLQMSQYPEKMLIGGHPMAGTEKAGFRGASPLFFKEKIFVLIFVTEKSLNAKTVIREILEKIGTLSLELDAERHDNLVSLTSHLPYVLSLTLSSLARDFIPKDSLFKVLMASGFEGATRLSLTHEEMGKGILATNSSKVLNIIDEFSKRLDMIKSLINDNKDLLSFLSGIRNFQSSLVEKDDKFF